MLRLTTGWTATATTLALLVAGGAVAAGSAIAPGPDNRRFVTGLEGWTVEGREPVQLVLQSGRPRAILSRNTSLISPPTLVPEDAQGVGVLARAPRGRALLVVRALVEGDEPRRLAVLEPTGRLEEHLVSVAGLGGRVVRLELDPVTALGRTVQIGGVGPFRTTLRGWTVTRGVPSPVGRSTARLEIDEPLRAQRRLRLPPRARAVTLRLRGEGSAQLTVAGVRRKLRATSEWQTLRVPVPRGRRAASAFLVARPGFGRLELARVGAIARGQDTTRRA